MLSFRLWQKGFSILLLVSLFFGLVQPGGIRAMPLLPGKDDLAVVSAPASLPHEQSPPRSRPIVRSSVRNDISPALRDIEPISPRRPAKPDEVREVPMFPLPGRDGVKPNDSQPPGRDAVLQTGPVRANMPTPGQNFEGIGNVNGVLPPDTDGDVGPNHYVQMVNLSFAIWDKQGNLLYGPANNNTLWTGFGGICESHNDGDPIVLYDHLADRWLMSQFALTFPNDFHQCMAISQTGDPTGAWYRYDFLVSTTKMNDYPKFGVWPDGYYMSVNQFDGNTSGWAGAGAVAFERDQMLGGLPARMVYFDDPEPSLGGMLPADLDGTPPPTGAPNYFVQVDDGSPDKLQVWEFLVDWNTPANSTFTKGGDLPTAPFDSNMCGGARSCIPQPDTGQGLDAIADRLMFRLQYRNFDGYQTMVANHTVDVDGTDHAGIRWYELRDSGGSWFINQQGTYAGDTADPEHRWMGSIAMDGNGNMALGYSVSSSSVYPSIRYVGRLAGDPAGTMLQGETSLIAGGGSQTHPAARWGDYSAMAVDPVDECTFWYTQQYYETTSSAGWQTRIGAFRFPSCSSGPSGTVQGTVTDASTTGPIPNAQVTADVYSTYTDGGGFYSMVVPTGTYTLTAAAYGYVASTITNIPVLSGTVTTQDFALTPAPTVIVNGTVTDGSGGSWPLYARIDIQTTGYNDTIFTDPETGAYSVQLVEGMPYTFEVSAVSPGYNAETRLVTPPSGGSTENFALTVDIVACEAPGYSPSYIYFEDFESGFDNWTMTGLWNPENEGDSCGSRAAPFPSPSNDSYYGLDDVCTYNNGSTNSGELTMVTPVALPAWGNVLLSFSSYEKTECGGDCFWDNRFIEISTNGGGAWTTLGEGDTENTWYQKTFDLTPYLGNDALIRFRFDSGDGIFNDFFGWMVDDVGISTGCVSTPGGLVVGNVFDANTGDGLNGATVGNDSGYSTTTIDTPDDPVVDDGFYSLFSPTGSHVFTATIASFGTDIQIPTVAANDTIRQDFNLPAGQLAYTPSKLAVTVDMGTSTTLPLTLTNSGGLNALFEFKELDKGTTILGPFESPNYLVKPFKQGYTSTRRLTLPDPPPAPPYAAGNVLQTWPSDLTYAWGLGFNTNATDLWLGNLAAAGGDDLNYRFLLDGTNTGDTIDTSPWVGVFAADMTYNPLTGMLWQVNVGGDNCIHELDPANLVSTGNSICPGWAASQRGLAYDSTTDTYYAGSWNDAMIHHFAPDGTMLDEVNVGLAIAGLAYNPDTEHLLVMVNDSPNPVYVLDAANNYAEVGQFDVAGFSDFGGAGLEMDCEGNLWAIDQNFQTVYQFESGETTSMCSFDVPWLSEDPITGTVSSLASQPITVAFDASVPEVTQPGEYYAQLKIQHDTPYKLANVPVTMTVALPPDWGKLTGAVSGLAHCDMPGEPLKKADIFLESGTGMTWTLTTDISGTYQVWLDEANNPLTATVSYPGYITQTLTGLTVITDITTIANFDLRLEAPCVSADPDALSVTVTLGMSTTLPLTLSNTGAALATFNISEADQGFVPLAANFRTLEPQPDYAGINSDQTEQLVTRPTTPWLASGSGTLLIQDVAAWGFDAIESILTDNSIPYDVINSSQLATANFNLYRMIIIPSVQGSGYNTTFNANLTKFENFIDAGGLMIMSFTEQSSFTPYRTIPLGGTNNYGPNANNYMVDPAHPIFAGVSNPYSGNSASHNYLTNLLPDDRILATAGSVPGGEVVMIERNHGAGMLVAGGQTFEWGWGNGQGAGTILANMIPYYYFNWTGGEVPWLSEDPTSGTLVADTGLQLVDVTFDASVPEVTQPGDYYATLTAWTNEPAPDNSHTLPVTMTVITPENWGKLTGTVSGLTHCDGPVDPLENADLFLESGTGMTWTLTTDISGTYQVWLDQANNPLTVTVGYPGYVTQTLTGSSVTSDTTTTADFDLRLDAPCVSVAPYTLSVTLDPGISATLSLTLSNTGAVVADFAMFELDGGFTASGSTIAEGTTTSPTQNKEMVMPGSKPERNTTSTWGISLPLAASHQVDTQTTTAAVSLPVIISDPSGDATVIDVTTVAALVTASDLTMRLQFSPGSGPIGAIGVIHLDTDQNAATGLPPTDLYGLPSQDIGYDYYLDLFSLPGRVDILDANGSYIASVSPVYSTETLEFTIPLSALGNDDGQIAVTMVLGDLDEPRDWAPDVGHGSISGDVPWLSADPINGTLGADTGTQVVEVTINGSGLTQAGQYNAILKVNSDDPGNGSIDIPVTMTINPYKIEMFLPIILKE